MTDTAARKLVAFAAVFTVSDVGRSLDYYLRRLGFREFFRLGDPISYAIVERDAVSLHLMPASQDARGLGSSSIYVFATDVDALHDELRALDCPIEKVPMDYAYGMREMSVRDLDGNRITFGQEVKARPIRPNCGQKHASALARLPGREPDSDLTAEDNCYHGDHNCTDP